MAGNYCTSCQKFASLEAAEPETPDVTVNAESEEVSGEIRLVLACADCGGELKETNLEFVANVNDLYDHAVACDKADNLEASVDSVETTDRYADKDRHGKPIKSFRYRKHFYGVELSGTITCGCGSTWEWSTTAEQQAGGFDEL